MTPPSNHPFETHNRQQFRPAKAKAMRVDLPPGAYTLHQDDFGPFFNAHPLVTDELIHSSDPREVQLREEVATFFRSGHLYAKHGFTHRRGVLLHGPAGSGKSCLLRSFCQDHIASGGHVIIQDRDEPSTIWQMTRMIQNAHPGSKVIVVIEELEEFVSQRGEHGLLALLDGERALEGALIVATTNYPEKLNKRIINRPRRFDRVLFVGMPGADVRREYFRKKLFIDEAELEEWTAISEGFSFAAMADLVISTKCLGIPLQKAASSIRAMVDATPNSDWQEDQLTAPPPQPHAPEKPTFGRLYLSDEAARNMGLIVAAPAHPFVAPIMERIEESATLSNGASD